MGKLVAAGVLAAALTAAPAIGAVPQSAADASPVGIHNRSASALLSRMTLQQRVGQLFMVGGAPTGVSSATRSALTTYHVGNVILTGRSTAGVTATRKVSDGLQRLSTHQTDAAANLLVSTDQEGGYVQVLQGPGFSRMPTALTQGTWSDSTLYRSARAWAWQLRSAGVNVNLAPVMDVVSSSFAPYNQPIGYYQREFGHTPSVVASKGGWFLLGMRSRGVGTTAKHFPTLGRVRYNTDTHSGVVDRTTYASSTWLNPFKTAIADHSKFVMVSTAYYEHIDPNHPAAFSHTIVTDLLRDKLGFTGVIVSDDLGNAKQVQAWSPATRAIEFLDAGGDLVLTGNTTTLPSMVNAVVAKAESNSAFRARVNQSALRVLQAKQSLGLLRWYAPLTVNGRMDAATASALQVYLLSTRTGSWDSNTRECLQRVIGTGVDGVWGPNSQAALQSFLGISHDGSSSLNARTVAALQRYLNGQR
jgi:beta-N-acetylhexosaminidase